MCCATIWIVSLSFLNKECPTREVKYITSHTSTFTKTKIRLDYSLTHWFVVWFMDSIKHRRSYYITFFKFTWTWTQMENFLSFLLYILSLHHLPFQFWKFVSLDIISKWKDRALPFYNRLISSSFKVHPWWIMCLKSCSYSDEYQYFTFKHSYHI